VLFLEAAVFVSLSTLVEWLARRQWRHAEHAASINGWTTSEDSSTG
jgi:hypothetical protein